MGNQDKGGNEGAGLWYFTIHGRKVVTGKFLLEIILLLVRKFDEWSPRECHKPPSILFSWMHQIGGLDGILPGLNESTRCAVDWKPIIISSEIGCVKKG